MKNYLLIFVFLNFFGCMSKIKINPDYLKPAFLNKYYVDSIKIEDINILDIDFFTDLPSNSGLVITIEGEPPFDRNVIKIQGTPKVEGNYQIEIKGEFRGGVMDGVTDFNKKYDLVINSK